MESRIGRISALSIFSVEIKYILLPPRGGEPHECLPAHLNPRPHSGISYNFTHVHNYPRVHSKPLSNIFWSDVCAWAQLDSYLLWDHIRRCSWLFTTMTFSVSLRGPSQQASETWALCYNAPLCPWRMASWLWCGPGKFSGWVAAPKSIWTFQSVPRASWPGLGFRRKTHWKRGGSKVRVFSAGSVLRQSV